MYQLQQVLAVQLRMYQCCGFNWSLQVASGKSSKWYVERLDVTNLSTSTTQTFKWVANRWQPYTMSVQTTWMHGL
jgi:hypothetical protein